MKQNTILLLAGLGLVIYYLTKKKDDKTTVVVVNPNEQTKEDENPSDTPGTVPPTTNDEDNISEVVIDSPGDDIPGTVQPSPTANVYLQMEKNGVLSNNMIKVLYGINDIANPIQ